MTKIKQDIYDGAIPEEDSGVEATVSVEDFGIILGIKGYSDHISEDDEGRLVWFEVYEGKLRLIVYADIQQEDPTHIINLEGARNERRCEDEKFTSTDSNSKLG